jgi:hypothetical protein
LLAEAIVRIGRPLARSVMTVKDRIRWLTDVDSESCKNYFQHVWVVELAPDEPHDTLHFMEIGEMKGEGKKAEFNVDSRRNIAFPIHFPNGGNPLNAQGVYPLPCYLMWDPHIKAMKDAGEFAADVLLPRLLKTVPYTQYTEIALRQLAQRVANRLAANIAMWLKEDKQLGILMIFDPNLPCFHYDDISAEIRIQESGIRRGQWMALDGPKVLEWIREAKVREATELGESKDQVSTFTNQKSERVVSLYNKSWLWLAPTWEMPRSIYWKDNEWIKGIKVDPETYEYFYYGTQFMKAIQVPISSAILKEMFAPVMHAEARQKIKATSFEQIYGIPMLLPLLDGDSDQQFRKYRLMLRPDENMSRSALHLRLLAGLDLLVPESDDDYRLTILYYSGDLSRGNMHIRAMIEDVIPSVARRVQDILEEVYGIVLPNLKKALGLPDEFVHSSLENLPAMLANAFGPGYVWDMMQKVLHRQPIRLDRLHESTARKCNDSAKQQAWHHVRLELLFYWAFMEFAEKYEHQILKTGKGYERVDWQRLLAAYETGSWDSEPEWNVPELGFVSGLLTRQFQNSYYAKTGKEFVKSRMLKFGSKLTPQMVWENGLIEFQKLIEQRDLGIGKNFAPALARALLLFPRYQREGLLDKHRNEFVSTFWSGYLMYKKADHDPQQNGNENENAKEEKSS